MRQQCYSYNKIGDTMSIQMIKSGERELAGFSFFIFSFLFNIRYAKKIVDFLQIFENQAYIKSRGFNFKEVSMIVCTCVCNLSSSSLWF